MKTKLAILVFVSLLLFSCAPATPPQEDEVVEIATEEIVTEAPVSQPVTTEEPIVTEEPTEAPIACVTLLTPTNGIEISPVGKVTFSWTTMDEAGKYFLTQDKDGSEICVSEFSKFGKSFYQPPQDNPTDNSEDSNEDSKNSDGGNSGDSGGGDCEIGCGGSEGNH